MYSISHVLLKMYRGQKLLRRCRELALSIDQVGPLTRYTFDDASVLVLV